MSFRCCIHEEERMRAYGRLELMGTCFGVVFPELAFWYVTKLYFTSPGSL